MNFNERMIALDISRLKGVIVASPTPFTKSRDIDEEGTRRLMRYYINCGINGVFLLSSTGEYFTITQEKRLNFVNMAIDEINGKLPVMVMISDACIENVLRNLDLYTNKKIDAVVLTPPYYYKYSQDELYKFFTIVADKSPIPLILYNQPMRLPNNISLELVKDLSKHKNIIGIKDTSSEADKLLRLLSIFKGRDDFLIYTGSERLAAYASLFGGNFIYALAAVNPELFTNILEKGRNKDIDGVAELQNNINELFEIFNSIRGGYKESFSNFTHSIKAALKLKGIFESYNSQLGYELNNDDYDKIYKFIN